MSKGQSLQDPYLNILRKERIPVSIFLVNGIKLQGQIESFDQFVILLRNTVSQMVYKHAISTVVPSRNVRLPAQDPAAPQESQLGSDCFSNVPTPVKRRYSSMWISRTNRSARMRASFSNSSAPPVPNRPPC